MAAPVRSCLLCGTPGHTCGPVGTGAPVDLMITSRSLKGTAAMADTPQLKVYEYTLNGQPTIGQLTEADAKRLNATAYKGATAGVTAIQDDVEYVGGPDVLVTKKRTTTQNKAK